MCRCWGTFSKAEGEKRKAETNYTGKGRGFQKQRATNFMKSGMRKTKASGSTRRRVEDIVLRRGRYTPARLAARRLPLVNPLDFTGKNGLVTK